MFPDKTYQQKCLSKYIRNLPRVIYYKVKPQKDLKIKVFCVTREKSGFSKKFPYMGVGQFPIDPRRASSLFNPIDRSSNTCSLVAIVPSL